MRTHHKFVLQLAAAAVCFACVDAAGAATPLVKVVPPAVAYHLTSRVGFPDPSLKLQLAITLPMRNQAQLDALLAQIYDPKSPQYRQYLSVAEFTDRFGPTEADYAAAVSFFSNAGFQVTGVTANRYVIDVAGRVSDIERVFHVKMGLYKHPTENRNFIAPDREPSPDLPVDLLHVTGLDDYTLPAPRLVQSAASSSRTGTGSGPKGYFIGSDIRKAYVASSPLTGAGQSLGLMELEGYNVSDVDLYFSNYGPPLTVPINGISADGSPVTCTTPCRMTASRRWISNMRSPWRLA